MEINQQLTKKNYQESLKRLLVQVNSSLVGINQGFPTGIDWWGEKIWTKWPNMEHGRGKANFLGSRGILLVVSTRGNPASRSLVSVIQVLTE